MGNVGPLIVTVIGGIIGLAVVAVLMSQKAQTSSVISSAGTALSSVIGAAVAPISNSQSNNFGSGGIA